MNAVKSDVEKLVQKELESANQRFPMFRSDHEGYAVIKEEVEEAHSELNDVELQCDYIWNFVKQNAGISYMNADLLYKCAISLACEAIQVAAMAQKFMDSQKEREKSEGN